MLMLLDSAGLYFRAFHGTPTSLTSPDGIPVNAVRGFLDMVATLVASQRPNGLVACWDDDWRPSWRVELLGEYKAHRVARDGSEETPDALVPQVEVIVEVLRAIGIARVGCPGFEADDVMATLARRAARDGQRVEVVTGDRDLLQLVDDEAGIAVRYVARGIGRAALLDEAAVRAAHGVSPRQYADLAVLRGDPSDGLAGIRGVGAKTAASLLDRFGTIDGLLAAVRAGTPAVRPAIASALLEGTDYLRRAERVVRVADVPLPEVSTALPSQPIDPAALEQLCRRWGIAAPVARLLTALAGTAGSGSPPQAT